jgi:hypothetical protein
VKIGLSLHDEGIIEVETESDGHLSLCNVFAQFPNTCGLKYQAPNSKFWRGVRRVGDSFFPPFASGWDGILFMLLFLEVLVGEKFVYFKY